MDNDGAKFPQEEQITKLVDDTVRRIEQLHKSLAKEYGRGPELRPNPPDWWNSPDSPFVRIEQLTRSIESNKLNALKKTFELAETLPKDNREAAIRSAFDKLAPEINAREFQQQKKENLTDHFKDTESRDKEGPKDIQGKVEVSTRIPFYSRFLESPIKKQSPEKTIEISESKDTPAGEKPEAIKRKPFVSQFIGPGQPQPFQSRFIEVSKSSSEPSPEKTEAKPARKNTPEKDLDI